MNFAKKNKINAHIPVQNEQVDISKYKYDSKNDIYIAQDGCNFLFKQYSKKRSGKAKRGRPKKSESKEQKEKLYELHL